ncbi:MAG: FAD-dependent oxidoreductase [Firmicutes bacterium]|nr:FAD-dependent oxidoreductase [Bacillota bacterium]
MEYTRLKQEIKVNGTTFKNRLVVPAMVTSYCEENGMPTEQFIAYHEEKAKGGWGMIIVEDYAVAPKVGGFTRLPGLWEDAQIEPHKELTRRVHEAGGKICAQIYHAGRETTSEIIGKQPVGPSAVREPSLPETPRELTKEEIEEIIEQFGQCARRVVETGFDAVEIHGAHGYLLGAFISPLSNKRTDEYGGSLEGRAKFPLAVVKRVREAVGPDFPIIFRMSTTEYVDGGFAVQDAMMYSQLLEEAGVDMIHCSQGIYATAYTIQPPFVVPEGYYQDNAAAVKSVVDIPVIAVGKFAEPIMAETVLKLGKADMISMGRASLADPHLPNKLFAGETEDIIRCIGCVQGCIGDQQTGVRCLVNPRTGKEYLYKEEPAEVRKKVLVAGGGVAGSEFAIEAARRGHEVILCECADRLGGQWIAASMPVGKTVFTTFLKHQSRELEKLGVDVRLGTAVTKELVDQEKPDVVVVATGGTPIVPPIPGVDRPEVIAANDVLLGRTGLTVGQKIAVIGGGMVGAETADMLAQQQCQVSIIEMLPEIVPDGEENPTWYLMKRLKETNVDIHVNSRVTEIGERSVTFEKDGQAVTLEDVDAVVLAVGVRPENGLAAELADAGCEVCVIGDAEHPDNGYHGIQKAYDLAYNL